MHRLKPLAIVLLLLTSIGPAGAGLEDIRAAAEAGDAEAQLELGILYEYGFGMKDNEVVALAWYLLAAERGSPRAVTRRDLLLNRLAPKDVEAAQNLRARLLKTPAAPPAPAAPAPPP
jgi:TPR repeat protein